MIVPNKETEDIRLETLVEDRLGWPGLENDGNRTGASPERRRKRTKQPIDLLLCRNLQAPPEDWIGSLHEGARS